MTNDSQYNAEERLDLEMGPELSTLLWAAESVQPLLSRATVMPYGRMIQRATDSVASLQESEPYCGFGFINGQ